MIHLTKREVDDLRLCQRALERVLATLDSTGAGIAAIHVDAAIEQLKKNLALAKVIRPGIEDTPLVVPGAHE